MKTFVRLGIIAAMMIVRPKGGLALEEAAKPNILFLLVDDWGGGDVDMCPDDVPFEHCPFRPTTEARRSVLNTPRIKQMASEGQILSNFYSPRAICTPSRAAYLSGRDPSRYGLVDELFRILLASSVRGGFTPEEKSFGKYLKEAGYNTGYSGKWHLGLGDGVDPIRYTPISHGFDDTFFFVEGSNGEACDAGALNPEGDDNVYHMCSFDHVQKCDSETHTCEVVEQPIRWENATSRHLSQSLDFITKHKDDGKPWVLMHAFLHVHVPWVPSRTFVTDPQLKLWTDMVGEVDWAVGVFLQKLKDLGLDENTLVVLTSDNGPYMESASTYCPQNCRFATPSAENAGSPRSFGCTLCDSNSVSLPLNDNVGGKGNTYEGGLHVPSIWWWPGKIEGGTINPIVSSGLDLLPTFVALAGGDLDAGIAYDGRDISGSLLAPADADSVPEGSFVYWCGMTPMSVRNGRYKIIWKSQDFVTSEPTSVTPKTLCAGTGKCCAGSPSRLCTCIWASEHDPPLVIDLMENPMEDFKLALTSDVQDIIDQATTIRNNRIVSTAEDRGIADLSASIDTLLLQLVELPNMAQVDNCPVLPPSFKPKQFYCNNVNVTADPLRLACDYVPDECQKTTITGAAGPFYKYANCSIDTLQGPQCAQRLPCCKQEGYEGPFEYNRPIGDSWDGPVEQCGCFMNGKNSYFEDQASDHGLMQSVCDWQDDVMAALESENIPVPYEFCRLAPCAEKTTNNDQLCETIKKYGLDNIPTGKIFNSAYPDTQFDASLRYVNQDQPPKKKKTMTRKKGRVGGMGN